MQLCLSYGKRTDFTVNFWKRAKVVYASITVSAFLEIDRE